MSRGGNEFQKASLQTLDPRAVTGAERTGSGRLLVRDLAAGGWRCYSPSGPSRPIMAYQSGSYSHVCDNNPDFHQTNFLNAA